MDRFRHIGRRATIGIAFLCLVEASVPSHAAPVSYTHLTLPTIYSV